MSESLATAAISRSTSTLNEEAYRKSRRQPARRDPRHLHRGRRPNRHLLAGRNPRPQPPRRRPSELPSSEHLSSRQLHCPRRLEQAALVEEAWAAVKEAHYPDNMAVSGNRLNKTLGSA
ncbi:hypothetical protein MNVI_18010 [Mycobacterium noviomagense]|uniref:Uncharacterized protein n=1 Tax=Mycobacterium noviomagense TaxID=459858 RepID=A0A7I7PCZ3_9MYCO|nr:hypothetical protein MNVI_18010 [Mycobacterium noviomagense]